MAKLWVGPHLGGRSCSLCSQYPHTHNTLTQSLLSTLVHNLTSSSAVPYIEASRGLISSKQKDLCWWKEGSWKAGGQSAGETDTHLHLDVDLDNFLTETLRFWEYPIFLYLFNAYLPITPGFTESSQLTSKIQRFPGTFSCDGGAGGSSNFSPTAKLMRKEAATRWVFKVIDLEIIGIIDGSLRLMPRKVQDQGSGV